LHLCYSLIGTMCLPCQVSHAVLDFHCVRSAHEVTDNATCMGKQDAQVRCQLCAINDECFVIRPPYHAGASLARSGAAREKESKMARAASPSRVTWGAHLYTTALTRELHYHIDLDGVLHGNARTLKTLLSVHVLSIHLLFLGCMLLGAARPAQRSSNVWTGPCKTVFCCCYNLDAGMYLLVPACMLLTLGSWCSSFCDCQTMIVGSSCRRDAATFACCIAFTQCW